MGTGGSREPSVGMRAAKPAAAAARPVAAGMAEAAEGAALRCGEAGVATALDRIRGALWGLYIGDAMAMPSHWYYGGAAQVARDYGGPIRGYVQPRKELAGSIMNKSSTGGGGRGSDSGEIIGAVINHGKKQFWTARGSDSSCVAHNVCHGLLARF
ncbi:unnamed protein product [Prorocentrum cordatum]|uniref:Uncharacterized protein n=1 Tax=Prorocentrum cordatum TaxID=2364126 RepID=A0ABN9YCK2_9DINO|nr:unnamed protein product [Polarella glacialis]